MREDRRDSFWVGLGAAVIVTVITLALLGVVDMDDTKQRSPLPTPATLEVLEEFD